jgi:uncharacterized repeat protein (TIGR02543 family)
VKMSTKLPTKTLGLFIAVILAGFGTSFAGHFTPVATTPEWCNFGGTLDINDIDAVPGDEVGAFDPDGVCCGAFTVVNAGYYGWLPVYKDDNTTPSIDEGAEPGDIITFKIWDASAGIEYSAVVVGSADTSWTSNVNKIVHLKNEASVSISLTVVSSYGSPVPNVGSHTYQSGDPVTAEVSSPVYEPNGIRYVCTGWTGTGSVPASGTGTTVSFNITENSTITWNWKTQYYLTTNVTPPSGGSVTPSSGWYDAGSQIQLQATVNTNFEFTGWSGDLSGSTSPVLLQMNGPKEVTGNFTLVGRYFSPFGKTPNPCSFYGTIQINGIDADVGDEIGAFDPDGVCCGAFKIEENPGIYGYMEVYGDDTTTPSIDEGAVSGDTITFKIWDESEQREYIGFVLDSADTTWEDMGIKVVNLVTGATLSVSSGYGSPNPGVGTHIYATGTSVTASVVSPAAGPAGTRYVCTGWTGTGNVPASGTGTSVTFDITENSTITWNWKTQYFLTTAANPVSGGSVTPSSGWYDAGSPVQLQATVNADFEFSVWSGDLSGTTNPVLVTINAPKSITGNFTELVELLVVSQYGSPSPAVGTHAYMPSTNIDCSVDSPVVGPAGTRYICTGWTGTGNVPVSGTGTSVSFTITQYSTITWNWKVEYYMDITSAYGTPTGEGWYDAGFTANWSVNSPVAGAQGVQYVASTASGSVLMDGPKNINVVWTTQYYLATFADPPEGGGVTPTSNWQNSNSSVHMQATANTGYTFTGWSGSLSCTTNPVDIIMDGPKEITGHFRHFVNPSQTSTSCRFYGTLKIDEADAGVGDEIGAFDPDGVCCGTYVVTNTGVYGDLYVYGDDGTTPEDEGAEPGDTITFMVWDASSGRVYSAGSLGPDTTDWGNGLYKNVDLATCQKIPLRQGWNLFSFSVNKFFYDSDNPPAVATLPDLEYVHLNDIGDALASIAGKYEVIKGFDAEGSHTYVPGETTYNTLHYLAPGYGYWLKMTEDAVLVIQGKRVNPESTMNLSAGWNLIGYWGDACYYDSVNPPVVQFPEDLTEFSSVDDIGDALGFDKNNIVLIRGFDEGGFHTYAPDTPDFNTLHYFAPGYGYWLKVDTQGSLHW